MESTILVTGGAGFIGSNFVIQWMKNLGTPVVNLDLLTYAGNINNLKSLSGNANHIFVKGDIADQALVESLIAQYKPRAIVNFAAESHVDRSIADPSQFIHTNILGVYNLLVCARDYFNTLSDSDKSKFRFLHVSTDEVFGSLDKDSPAFTEQSPYEPNSPYSASKASSDHLVRAWFHTFGLPTLITNCSNNYGQYQFPEKLIPLVITNALSGKELPIYGDGQNIRDWLYVDDHCSAIAQVLENGIPGESYNIGGNNEKTNLEVVSVICSILDKLVPASTQKIKHPTKKEVIGSYKELIHFVTDRKGHDRRYAINSSKIQKELQWCPQETFESGIEKTVAWYVNNKDWTSSLLDVTR